MTVKSTIESLYYSIKSNNSKNGDDDDDDGNDIEGEIKKYQQLDGNKFLINLMDTPGHIDFTPEVTASLRISDGTLIVVDCVDGVGIQTENVLRQALCDCIKPVLVINKLDHALLKFQPKREELYQSFNDTVGSINTIISTYGNKMLENLQVYPNKGTVVFTSGLHGWGFTLNQFAIIYSKKFGVKKEKILKRLWGEHYYNFITKKWTTEKRKDDDDHSIQRGFNVFVLDPIYKLFDYVMNHKKESMMDLLSKLSIQLTTEELELSDKPLLKLIMKRFLPCDEAILQTICIHLPSPKKAQSYRTQYLYQGSMDHPSAIGMKECDPEGPLMIYISKIVPRFLKGEETRFYAFGRVFSGTVNNETDDVYYIPPSYQPGIDSGHWQVIRKTKLQHTFMIIGRLVMEMNNNNSMNTVDDSETKDNKDSTKTITAGNLIFLTCKDPFLFKSGTIATSTSYAIKAIKTFNVTPIVQLHIDVQDPTDLPKLINGLRQLELTDSSYSYEADRGDHVIFANGELHLKYCKKKLIHHFAQVPIKTVSQNKKRGDDVDDPWVSYCETIQEESSIICMSKSPNKRNRIFMRASPLDPDLMTTIEHNQILFGGDKNVRAKLLHDQFHWDLHQAKKIWAFGPDCIGPNVLVEDTKGVQFINEIQRSANMAFQWATREGPLINENLRGCRFNILDTSFDATPIRRGGGQIVPTIRRVMAASMLTAQPTLQEPIYLVHIRCSKQSFPIVHQLLQKCRGIILDEKSKMNNNMDDNNDNDIKTRIGLPMIKIKAHLPVSDSFGFNDELKKVTLNQATCEFIFDHWSTLDGNPLEPGNKVYDIVRESRIRKGLSENVFSLDKFNDKL